VKGLQALAHQCAAWQMAHKVGQAAQPILSWLVRGRLPPLNREEHGLGAMDALHLAAAHAGGAEEPVTTEKRSKPIHRSSLVKVVYLYQRR